VLAALLAGGVGTAGLLPAAPAAAPVGDDRWLLADLVAREAYRLPRRLPGFGPGSLGLALRALRARSVVPTLCGLLPRGLVPTDTIQATVRRLVPSGWAPRAGCWIVACDYSTGERVVFGRDGAPRTSLATAVGASCAIPGFFRPVPLAGRLYVDGGLHSLSNLDLMAGRGLDLVVALNPMSGVGRRSGWSPLARLTSLMRKWSARQVAAEAAALTRDGTAVLLLEPTERDLAAMGDDVMDASRASQVAEVALATTLERLRRPALRSLLRRLPA
jgi:NTE family protein